MSEVPMIVSLSHALAHARQAELRRVATARRDAGPGRTRRRASAGNVAFLSLFAAQAGLLTLSPILPGVAREFGISTAAAGQLRTLAGLSGGIAALAVVLVGARVGLRRLLLAGTGLLVLGSAASAAAPTLIALATAQVMVGAAAGLLIAGGLAAAATWAPAGRQTKALARASRAALAAGGYPALGLTLAALFALGTTPHIRTLLAERSGVASLAQSLPLQRSVPRTACRQSIGGCATALPRTSLSLGKREAG